MLSLAFCLAKADVVGWRACTPAPLAAAFAATTIGPDGKVYVIGGEASEDDQKPLDANRIYDPQTDRWSLGAPLPVPTVEPVAALGANGKIYVVGGGLAGVGRHASGATFEYDPQKDTWRSRKPMPTARTGLAFVAGRNKEGKTLLYAIGGRDFIDPHNGLTTVEAYDPEADEWKTMAPMPTHRHGLSATLASDGNIYAIGGAYRDDLKTPHLSDDVEVYNPRSNSWSKAKPFPNAVECEELVSTRGRLFAVGGWFSADKTNHADVYSYGLPTKSWSRLPDAPFASAGGGAVTLRDGSALFVGGIPSGTMCEEYRFTK